MARRSTPAAVWILGGLFAVGAAGAGWWLSQPEETLEPEVVEDDDTGMTKDQEKALLQEIGYIK